MVYDEYSIDVCRHSLISHTSHTAHTSLFDTFAGSAVNRIPVPFVVDLGTQALGTQACLLSWFELVSVGEWK